MIFDEFIEAGYKIYKNGGVNIFARRNKPYKLNTFNDDLFIYWRDGRKWDGREYKITTMPGKYWLNNLMNPEGAAILKPGQYLDCYKLGKHKGKDALVQCGSVTVYRDANKDDNFDFVDEDEGLFGINFHRAGMFSHFVNSWSAGCQVFQAEKSFISFIEICKERACFTNNLFSYTLIEENHENEYSEILH